MNYSRSVFSVQFILFLHQSLCMCIVIIIRQPLCPVVGRRPSACRLQMTLSCAVLSPLPYPVAPVFVQVVSPPLGWSPLSSFLVIWSRSGDARGPSVVFEAVNMPCPGPFHFSHSVDYIYEFCPLPDPDVGPSIFVCDVEHTSFHFGLCGRKFVLCLFGQCPDLCTICRNWQHTGVVHLSLQADGKVAFEDIPVFGVCRPACHDSSLYVLVLVLFREAVMFSHVHVAWDILYQHIVHVYRGVVYNHHLCLCDVHLKIYSSTFIG